jgi:hypothetical protein
MSRAEAPTRKGPEVLLREVEAENWRAVATLRVPEEQRDSTMGGAYYLSLCHYGDDWHPFAVCYRDEVVGLVMRVIDSADMFEEFGQDEPVARRPL